MIGNRIGHSRSIVDGCYRHCHGGRVADQAIVVLDGVGEAVGAEEVQGWRVGDCPGRWIDRDSAIAGRTGNDRGWIDSAIDIGIVADHAKHDGGIFIGVTLSLTATGASLTAVTVTSKLSLTLKPPASVAVTVYRSTGCAFGWRAAEGACGWVVAQPGRQPADGDGQDWLSTSLKVLAGSTKLNEHLRWPFDRQSHWPQSEHR